MTWCVLFTTYTYISKKRRPRQRSLVPLHLLRYVLRREQALNFCVCVKLPDDGMVAVTATNTIAAASCVLLFQCNFRPKAQRGCWQSVEIALFSLETHTHILVLLCTTFVISTKFMYKKQFYIIIVSVWKNIILALSNHLILPYYKIFVKIWSKVSVEMTWYGIENDALQNH